MFIRRLLTYSILSVTMVAGFFGSIHIERGHQNDEIVSISYDRNGVFAAGGGRQCAVGETSKPGAECESTPTSAVDKYNGMIDTLNIILAVLSAMISPIILFVGWLMSPDWTSGDLFGLRAPMYALWVTVSNIVYFVYAILLILIALGTMFGKESFSYKVMLPKLALGILMVPFTWWFVQWTISLASVVTASVMTIPAETITDKSNSKWFTTPSIPTQVYIDNRESSKNNNVQKNSMDCSQSPCISPKEFLAKSGGMYSPLVIYGYSVFRFKEITRLSTTLDVASAVLQIVHTSIISAIMFAVFGLLVLALAVMLLVRAIKLWVYAIFSPLFTFQFVAGSAMMGENKDTFTIKEFVGLCFVPAIVGLALSFGLIMINAVQSTTGTNPLESKPCDLKVGCVLSNIMGSPDNNITRKNMEDEGNNPFTQTTFNYAGVAFNFMGKAVNQSNSSNIGTGTLDAIGGMFGTLIIDIIALVFIWLAFMAAKNVSKAVSVAVQPFEDIGKKVGNLAMSIPKYTPIPGLGMSANSMARVPESMQSALSSADTKRFEKSSVGKLLNADKNIPTDKANKAIEIMGQQSMSKSDITTLIETLKPYINRENAYNSGVPDAFFDKVLKDEAKRKSFFNEANISTDNQKKFIDFLSSNKDGVNTEIKKKELMGLMANTFGGVAGTNAGAGTSGTTRPNQNGDGTISLGGININYNGINLSKNDEVANKIITGVTSKASSMNKPTLDDLKKELENMGLADKVEDTAKKIEEAINKLSFKPKS